MTQLNLPLTLPKCALQLFKEDFNYTFTDLEDVLLASRSHLFNVTKHKTPLIESAQRRMKEVRRIKELILGNPADKILLEKELQDFIDYGVKK